jgi:hypothetical protein
MKMTKKSKTDTKKRPARYIPEVGMEALAKNFGKRPLVKWLVDPKMRYEICSISNEDIADSMKEAYKKLVNNQDSLTKKKYKENLANFKRMEEKIMADPAKHYANIVRETQKMWKQIFWGRFARVVQSYMENNGKVDVEANSE